MRIVSNSKSIKRNETIARYTLIVGIAVLVAALFANLYVAVPMLTSSKATDALTPQQSQFTLLSFVGLLVGYTLTTISTSLNSRYGRRPDKGLQAALRGNSDAFALYNYALGANHVLVGPGGTFVLIPKYQNGVIQCANGKWKHAGQSLVTRFLFRQDALGNPTMDAKLEVDALQRHLKKHAPELSVEPQPVIVFMSPRAVLDVAGSPLPAVQVKQLKEFVRKQPKRPSIPADVQARLAEGLTTDRATQTSKDDEAKTKGD